MKLRKNLVNALDSKKYCNIISYDLIFNPRRRAEQNIGSEIKKAAEAIIRPPVKNKKYNRN